MEALVEFFYGSLRSMKDEYLERTYRKLDPSVQYLDWVHQRGLGDDNVYIVCYDENYQQLSRKTYRSSLCYEIAEQLAEKLLYSENEEPQKTKEEEQTMSKAERQARYRYQYKLNGYSWLGKQPWMYQGIILEETQV